MDEEDIPEEYLENVNTPDNENKSNRIKTITPCRKWQDMDLPLAPEPTWEQPEWLQNNYSPKVNIKFKVTINEIKMFLGILLLSGYCSVPRYRMYWETSSDTHNIIVNCSNNYAFQKGNIKFKVTINEIKVFLRILLLSGYCSVPRYRIYWETSSDTHNEVVSKATSRNTFKDILKYLHVCNNLTLDENDKFVDKLPHGQYSIYIDNFFTSVRLLEELKSKGHYCTGTIRSNRIEKAAWEEASTLKKKVRCSYSQLTDTDSGIALIRYHNNNIVTLYRFTSKGKEDKLDLLGFTRFIVQTYLSKYSIRSSSRTITKTFEKTSV
uniref:PiggyBac transposable element-derived protein domain-containing protein n=1 Tax=Timema genevievae TaxID=629358 RepID=A0A7R9PMT9_TIMGE|nr:unnamed protein product [Timema genevievae]